MDANLNKFSDQFAEEVNDHHTTMTLPIELTNSTGTHLDHLNEYCLLEIFSVNSLTVLDLCSLAETCKLFERVAQRVSKTLNISNAPMSKAERVPKIKDVAEDVERILKKFGRCIAELEIDSAATNVMDLVAKHCVAGTLKELEMTSIDIAEAVAVELQPIFRQLQTLTIDGVSCGANVFANCDSLVDLRFVGPDTSNQILQNNFPQLQRFWTWINSKEQFTMVNFLERHKNLKYLHLPNHYFNAMEDFLRKLGHSCNALEELELEATDADYDGNVPTPLEFSMFQSLRCLQLGLPYYDNGQPTIVRIKNAKSLQVLEINGPIDSGFLADLPFLKNLRELRVDLNSISGPVQLTSFAQLTKLILTGIYHVGHNVVDIVRQLSDLEELTISVCKFALSEKEFHEIVKLTKGRRNVLTLKCRFEFSQSSGTYKNICEENLKVKLIKF